MFKETTVLDSGYSKSGVYWEIHRFNLRFATVLETRVNGKATHFRKLDDCYKHLQSTGVQSFRKILADGKVAYEALMEAQDAGNTDDDNGSTDSSA